MKTQNASNRPVHTIRYGAIKASIWLNQTRNGQMYNVTMSRAYKDGDQWKDSTSLGYDDLLVAAKAVVDCHTWIHGQLAGGDSSSRPE